MLQLVRANVNTAQFRYNNVPAYSDKLKHVLRSHPTCRKASDSIGRTYDQGPRQILEHFDALASTHRLPLTNLGCLNYSPTAFPTTGRPLLNDRGILDWNPVVAGPCGAVIFSFRRLADP